MKALIKSPSGVKATLKDIPTPTALPGQLLLRPLFLGLCRTDLYVAANKISIDKPVILGLSQFKVGDLVVVKPVTHSGFMGLNCDGALSELIVVSEPLVYPVPQDLSSKLAVYFEPVAAALGVLKLQDHTSATNPLLIVGDNRIAELTQLICESNNISAVTVTQEELLNYNVEHSCVLETELSKHPNIDVLLKNVKRNGHVICKSRCRTVAQFTPNSLVWRDITIHGVSYGHWGSALPWINKNQARMEALIGPTYDLADWEQAFHIATVGETQKVIIRVT